MTAQPPFARVFQQKRQQLTDCKRVLAIMAGILVARHLKTVDDLFDSKPSPRNETMFTAAIQVGRADHAED